MQKTVKRELALFLSIVLIFAAMTTIPCFADFDRPIEDEEIEEFIDLSTLYGNIRISSDGCATCAGYARSGVYSDTVYLYLTLQRSSNGSSWSNYASLGSTSGSPSAGMTKYYYVAPGYYYRVCVEAYVYTSSGSYVEGTSAFSGADYY